MMPIKLGPGQQMKDLVIKLTPQGMIYGRVIDEDGEPLPNLAVQALRWVFLNGKRQLQPNSNLTSSADGTFVIGSLRQGRYVLCAQGERRNDVGGTQRHH